VKKILTDIPLQDFKNCFEQWLKCLEHSEEFEEDYFEKLLISAALKINL
jgi:hypothetical protein